MLKLVYVISKQNEHHLLLNYFCNRKKFFCVLLSFVFVVQKNTVVQFYRERMSQWKQSVVCLYESTVRRSMIEIIYKLQRADNIIIGKRPRSFSQVHTKFCSEKSTRLYYSSIGKSIEKHFSVHALINDLNVPRKFERNSGQGK